MQSCRPSLLLTLAVLLLATSAAVAQSAPDPQLAAAIARIKAIDNHTHVPRVVGPGEQDDEYDALPCPVAEPMGDPVAASPDNPLLAEARKALYGYAYNDATEAHLQAYIAAKERVKHAQGDHYPDWVLDHIGTDIMFANRIAMGRGLDAAHFRWVPYDDTLLFPLDNASMADNPDRKFFYGREEALLKRYLSDLKISALPPTLEEYLARVVTPTLESQKQNSAVAIKFETAYLRALDFAPAREDAAAAAYAQYVRGGVPGKADYKILQDYLFHYVAREAGRLGLAIHIHTGAGCGSYFYLSGSNPQQLEAVLNDPTLRKTNFVLVHGGPPFTKETAYLLSKLNVYTDISEQTWLLPPHALAGVIRYWLEWYPEKLMFGTDLFPNVPSDDWEEVGWMTSQTGRRALALALTGMMQDGEITRAQAVERARLLLRGNAIRLYGFKEK